uniref:Exostosin family protein n=1 Tax=Populus alba TaxID=43335 RepID=A0A4U5PTQ6_POPAL|nr:exostosin family protein [Populus alba]
MVVKKKSKSSASPWSTEKGKCFLLSSSTSENNIEKLNVDERAAKTTLKSSAVENNDANLTARDELTVRLADYLRSKPWWERHHGEDHFLVLGRTAWDFLRRNNDFGNSLLNLPDVQNMSVLTVERNPWDLVHNQRGIPYPSYFHPYTSHDMMTWQNKMRQSSRPRLLSFLGGPRRGVEKAAARDELRRCSESGRSELLK